MALRVAGALPPERCLVADDLFPELERRGCRFELHVPTRAPSEATTP